MHKPLQPPDSFHVRAAQGWLELGNHLEANEELEKITPVLKAHPTVLFTRWDIYAMGKKWDYAFILADSLLNYFPEESRVWINRSSALHEMRRTKEALEKLLPAVPKFPGNSTIPYNLACYACQRGKLDEAKGWLEIAFKVGDPKEMKLRALDDPDLQPLWESIGKL